MPPPGAMLYAPGGVLFGGFWGGLLSLSGNVLGAGLACQLMRTIFGESVQKWFALSALGRHQERIEQNGAWLVFLLRLNPLTSSDLVSYAAGLTRLSVWKLMAATLAGMAPLCFAQAYFADGMLASFPSLIYPLAAGCVLYAGLAIWILVSLVSRPGPVADSQPPHTPPGATSPHQAARVVTVVRRLACELPAFHHAPQGRRDLVETITRPASARSPACRIRYEP